MIRLLRVAGWWGIAAVLGWLCIGSLLDRLAQRGVVVTAPAAPRFGGSLLAMQANEAWRAGDLDTAMRLSRAAVARRPIDATTLRLAGSIALTRGDLTGGEALLRLAGAAGWRDRETQVFWAEAATQQGDWGVAIDRVEALARVGAAVDVRRLLRPIEAAPRGRLALLRRWREGGDWLLAAYGAWPTDDAGAMTNRYAVVRAMLPRLDREQRDRLAAGLVADERLDWAFEVARRDERRLTFEPWGPWGPLGWIVSAAPGLEADMAGPGGENLRIRASGPALLPVVEQLLRLPRGRTALDLPIEGAATDLPLIATLECVQGQGATATPTRSGNGHYAFDLTVPAGCPFQRLKLAVAGEEARRGADLRLGPPILSPAGAAP